MKLQLPQNKASGLFDVALRYGLAVAAVVAAMVFRLQVEEWVGGGLATYITFYPVVMVAALLGGVGPGLAATAAASLITAFSILPPVGQFSIALPVDRVGMVIFVGMGLFLSLLAHYYRRTREKAAAYDRELNLRELTREKAFLADLLENADQPFAVVYPDGRLGLVNRAFEQLTGYTAAELRAIDWSLALTPPEWRELEREKLTELARLGQPIRYEKECFRKDGTRVPIEMQINLQRAAAGQPEYFYAFLTDISERREAEAALRSAYAESEVRVRERSRELQEANAAIAAERQRFYDVLEMLPVYVILLDPDYRVPFANRFFRERFGESCGRRCYEYLFERTEPCPICETYTVMKTRAPHHWEWTGPDGRDYDIHDFPFTDSDGSSLIMEVGIDVTDRKQAEEGLRKAKETLEQRVVERTAELEAANRELEGFTYSVSHDLRAPIRHIAGFANLLETKSGPSLDADSLRYLAFLVDTSKRLGVLVDKLLEFSRIGRTEIGVAEVDLAPLIGMVVENFRKKTVARKIEWRVGDLPVVRGDATMLRFVVENLIDNAVKFTATQAQALIEIGQVDDAGNHIIFVRDNGVGFDMAYYDKMFGVFQRLHTQAEFEGTGIGLANVQRIIHRHGGRVWAEGKINGGAAFFFSLPKER
jgi:PAS domain S-box-containing protein